MIVKCPDTYLQNILRRKIYNELLKWKDSDDRKALVIKGARQVGKTFIVREFAENRYGHYTELNFLADPLLMKIFDENVLPLSGI